jgi:hypothetical protein
MALIAAFAVSGYATAFYRTHKPFNPLQGETYECVREDKGFRFISEQVDTPNEIGLVSDQFFFPSLLI